jgi:N-acetyl-anhydromuramyl-L-alanine amidase AmpD
MRKQLRLSDIIPLSLLIVMCHFFSSCATAPRPTLPPSLSPTVRQGDITHVVAPGETFWRISQIYDVPVAAIMQVNHMTSSEELKMGQRLLIPNAAHARPIVSLYPNRRWQYIVIHHSATSEGSSLSFHQSHLSKGWDKGVGYHFIINNATSGKENGQIEVTPRWLKQQEGAHCKASDMNQKGIGICLVGNFNDERLTAKQMDSLVYLVNTLRRYYKIPAKKILGHSQVRGSSTDCPGHRFPWEEFRSRLKRF